ncbi:carbonic anhydrase-related protein 10 [Sergentomyia squamirostris]
MLSDSTALSLGVAYPPYQWFTRSSTPIRHISLRSLLPNTEQFMTYEGSTTHPGCWESTVWIILNKPIYITKQELYALRRLMQGSEHTPKAPLGNNARPLQPLHHRTVRTNIDFQHSSKNQNQNCPTMQKEMYYRANKWTAEITLRGRERGFSESIFNPLH